MNPKIPNALIVDDNPADILICQTLLEAEGFFVQTAKDAFEALEKSGTLPIDLFVIDLNMPKMGGLELLKSLKLNESYKAVPVIIMSGRNQAKDVELAVRFGAQDYAVKPVDFLIMKSKISRLKEQALKSHQLQSETWFEYRLKAPAEMMGKKSVAGSLISISEVAFTLAKTEKFYEGESVVFDFSFIQGLELGEVHARAQACEDGPGGYTAQFSFVGLSEQKCKAIRLYCGSLKKSAEA